MGRYQGLNTGVVLYNLARMRESQQWQNYLEKVAFTIPSWYLSQSFHSRSMLFSNFLPFHPYCGQKCRTITNISKQLQQRDLNQLTNGRRVFPCLQSRFSGERCKVDVQLWLPCHCWRSGLVHKCQLQCKIKIFIQDQLQCKTKYISRQQQISIQELIVRSKCK